MKNHFVTNHGGRLLITKRKGHVKCEVLQTKKGFSPSSDNAMRTFWFSAWNVESMTPMCFQAGLLMTVSIIILPLLFVATPALDAISEALQLQELNMRGKYLTTFIGDVIVQKLLKSSS